MLFQFYLVFSLIHLAATRRFFFTLALNRLSLYNPVCVVLLFSFVASLFVFPSPPH